MRFQGQQWVIPTLIWLTVIAACMVAVFLTPTEYRWIPGVLTFIIALLARLFGPTIHFDKNNPAQ